jgi:phosphoglycolate phosphatase
MHVTHTISGVTGPVIFDLDGTVWDSAPGIVGCLIETLDRFGVDVPPPDELIAHLGPPLMTMLADLGVPHSRLDDARIDYRRRYREHGELDCVVYEDVPELLRRLRSAGHLLATATSKGVEPVHRMLDHFGLGEAFDVVAAASMTAPGHSKVDVITEALDGLAKLTGDGDHRSAATTMVGDRRYDVEGGRELGLTTVGVRWGYAPPGELEAAAPDHLVDDVAALADVFLAGRPRN